MSEVLQLAESIARRAHAGMLYGNGEDYAEAHLLPVVGMIARLGYGELYQAAGWLHDVVEDTSWTEEDLIKENIPLEVVEDVNAVTKQEGEPHLEYLKRISLRQGAVVVKFADSSRNYVATLLDNDLDKETYLRWVAKYSRNIAYLQPLLPKP